MLHQYGVQSKNYDRTASDLYVDKPLTNVSIAYKNEDYLADKILPTVKVNEETGLIWSYGKENFALKDLQRGDYSKSKQSSYSVASSKTYQIVNYALHDFVTEKMRKQAASPMQPDIDTTNNLSEILMLNKEYLAATALFNTGATGFSGYTETLNNATARYQWDDYTNSNPIGDSSYARLSKIRASSGKVNDIHMIVGIDVWQQLENHPDFLENIKYTGSMGSPAQVDTSTAAKLMKVSSIQVGSASYNSANEGQTASLSNVWGKYALFYHKGQPAIKTAATAVILDGGNWVRRWTEPAFRNASLIEVENALQVNLTSAESGYLFSTAVA